MSIETVGIHNPEAQRLGVLQAFIGHCGQFAAELTIGEDFEQLKKMPGRTAPPSSPRV